MGIKKQENITRCNTNKRYCPILNSIKNSFKEIKEFKMNKRSFKTLEESQKIWDKWSKKMREMNIKRWKDSKERFKFKVKTKKKSRMSVSMGILPTIRGEEAKRLLSKLKETTLDKETLKKYAEEVADFFDIKE